MFSFLHYKSRNDCELCDFISKLRGLTLRNNLYFDASPGVGNIIKSFMPRIPVSSRLV